MAQKANLTPVDKYESGRREAERLHQEKHSRLEAGLIDPVSAIQPAPTAEYQRREGLTFWQAVKTMFKQARPDHERSTGGGSVRHGNIEGESLFVFGSSSGGRDEQVYGFDGGGSSNNWRAHSGPSGCSGSHSEPGQVRSILPERELSKLRSRQSLPGTL